MSEAIIYNSIVTYVEPTDKQRVVGLTLSDKARLVSRDQLLVRAGRLGIDRNWAGTVIDRHMNCANSHGVGNVFIDAPSTQEIYDWRNSSGNGLPQMCELGRETPCLSSPDMSRVRCPILYGKQLEVGMDSEGKWMGDRRFDLVTLVIGDGPLLEALAVGRSNEAVVVCDPKIDVGKRILEFAEVGDFEAVKSTVLDGYRGIKDLSMDFERGLMERYRRLRYDNARNLFMLNCNYEGLAKHLPNNFFDRIICSFPYPMDVIDSSNNLLDYVEMFLGKQGTFVFRTESDYFYGEIQKTANRRQGVFSRVGATSYYFPPCLYELYFTSKYPEDAIFKMILRKR